jgi:hypothetical protein
MSTSAPPGDDPEELPRYARGIGRVPLPPPDGVPEDPPQYAPTVGKVPLPPPVHVQPRVFASPPAPPHQREWRVLLLALIVAGLLLLCFCLAGYAFFINGGLGAGE